MTQLPWESMRKVWQVPLNDSYAFAQNPRLGLQPEYNVSIYPGTGTVDGRTGDHVLLAPAYNTTESDIKLIADITVKVIEDRAGQQKLSKDAERRITRLRREFQESFNQTVVAHRTGADQGDANAQPHVVKHVAAGDQVRLKSMNKVAIVQREVEKDVFEVTLGPLKMRVKRDDIAEVLQTADLRQSERADPVAAARQQKNVHVTVTSANTDDMRMEINLIGRTVDEATEELEKYLDRAFLAGLPRVRVIHGHGAGILRRGVREFLKSHPHVATLAEAPQNEGGQGATLVELRQ